MPQIEQELLDFLIATAGFETLHQARWKLIDGDNTHVFAHDLTPSSIVFEVGAFLGSFAIGLYKTHKCNIYVFEPVEGHYFDLIQNLTKEGIKANEYMIALSNKSGLMDISVSGEASSGYCSFDNSHTEKVISVAIDDFMDAHEISHVDLLNMNIEGAEYDIMDYILDKDIATRFTNIQVQFHAFIPDYERRYASIHERLCATHSLSYQYPFVWENWKLKQ